MFEYIDRELAEAVWIETLEMMNPEELAEMERRQVYEREQDYFQQAFNAMGEALETEESA